MRTRAILLGVGFLAIVLLWFFFLFRPGQARIEELRDQQETVAQQIQQLEAELRRLQDLAAREPELRAQLARFQDAVPPDPRIPDFLLQVEEFANLAGVEFLSITPSLPSAFGGATPGEGQLQSISVTISTTGRYFELLDFIVRLERQIPRTVRVNNFSLSPRATDDRGSPTMSVSFALQIFVLSPAPAPAGTDFPPPEEPPTPPPAEEPPPADEQPTPVPE